MSRKLLAAFGSVAGAMVLAASANAAILVDFKSTPTTPNLAEFIWSHDALTAGPGAIGNLDGDGDLPPANQVAGGIQIDTPFLIPGAIPGKVLNIDTTTFYDVTLNIQNLVATGLAFPLGTQDVQPIGSSRLIATFALRSSTDGAGGGGTLLLSGEIAAGAILGEDGGTEGLVLSGDVTYTGGVILDALLAQPGTTPNGGSLSWSFIDVSLIQAQGPLHIDPDSGLLAPFEANGSGLFETPAIPEPASLALLGLGSLGLAVRRRRTV